MLAFSTVCAVPAGFSDGASQFVFSSARRQCWRFTVCIFLRQASVLARLETIKPQMDALAQEIGKEVAVATRMYSWDKRTARRTFNQAVGCGLISLLEVVF